MKRKVKIGMELIIIFILSLFILTTHAEALSYGACAWTYPRNQCALDGTYNPLAGGGLLPIAQSSSSSTREDVIESADSAVFGSDSSWGGIGEGSAIEPMAYARAETVVGNKPPTEPWSCYVANSVAFAYGEISIMHRIREKEIGTAPEEAKSSIPVFLDYNLEASGGVNITTSASFSVQTSAYLNSVQAANGESKRGTLSFDSSVYYQINIGVNAGVNAGCEDTVNGPVGKSGQAVADAFLYIDPNWEYAQYFVVEQESSKNPGEWVEVTRAWRSFCDFNNDGKTDLLWQHQTTGGVYAWLMDGVSLSSGSWVLPSSDLTWKLVGTGDFNRDGKTDLVWQHQTTGGVYVWLMDGVTLSSGSWVLYSSDLNWGLVGTGDFNNDGKTDLLWQHQATGGVYAWLMDGVTLSSGSWILPSSDLNWKLVAP